MEMEHPIPQQISSYQFRLVGDMTLKQFFQVAGGVVISLIIYSTGIHPIVKWPLILAFFLLGIGMAFFPIQDRPLEKWFVLFVNAIYSPTIYIWKHPEVKKEYFKPEEGFIPIPKQETLRVINQPGQNGSAQTALTDNVSTPRLDKSEQEFLSKITQHMQVASQPASDVKPVAPVQIIQTQIRPTVAPAPAVSSSIAETAEAPKITVYQSAPVRVITESKPAVKVQEVKSEQNTEVVESAMQKISPTVGSVSQNVEHASFSNQASPPIPPTKPNVVVGQVIDTDGKIIENAIIEIKDSEGRAVRAIKSNQLGHFMIVTSLSNGMYELIIEKDGFNFKPIKFEANGQIIRPIAIWAQKPN